MKYILRSKNGKMLKVGNSAEDSKWYFATVEVMKSVDSFTNGEEFTIEIRPENGSEYITKISKAGTASQIELSTPTASKEATATPQVAQGITTGAKPDVGVTPQKSGYLPKEEWIEKMKREGKWNEPNSKSSKSPEEQNTIKRQAIMHAVSRAMISMQGIITPDNMEEIAEKLYKKFQELVG